MLQDLEKVARRLRGQLVKLSHQSRTPHLGSALSCVDILAALYWNVLKIDPKEPQHPDRDRLILSKGHAATALYATLAEKGFFPASLLDSYAEPGCPLTEHPSPGAVPGIEAATGSLGHGLPIGAGMALAAKMRKVDYQTYVVMSDGECNEGSVWEAALFAAANNLSNLHVIIDYNKWQATGRSNETMALEPLVDKWRAFRWHAVEVDGHSIAEVTSALRGSHDAPTAIIAHTVKGKGVAQMEDDNNWHYRIPTEEEVVAAHRELELVTS